jgi:hypothetical protein
MSVLCSKLFVLLRNIEMKTPIKSLCAVSLLMTVLAAVPLSAATVSVLPAPYSALGELAGSKTQPRSNHHLAKAVRLNKVTRFAKAIQPGSGIAKGGSYFAAEAGLDAGLLQNVPPSGGSVASFLTSAGVAHAGRDLMFIAGKAIKTLSGDDDGGTGGPIFVVDGDATDTGINTLPPSPVPLPGAAGLMLIGLMALGASAKARRT